MARKLLELNTSNGSTILVAVNVPETAVGTVARSGDLIIEKVDQNFDKVRDFIVRSCYPLTEAFQIIRRETQAESAEVEYGINFTLSGNVYLVEASGESTFKVKVTWNFVNQNRKE